MTTRKSTSTATKFQPIDATELGEYTTADYSEKLYSTVYYTLRELQGLAARHLLGDDFSWNELKARFVATFGDISEHRYSLEQLLEYAQRKFGKSLQDLQEINDRSWERRRVRVLQQQELQEATADESDEMPRF